MGVLSRFKDIMAANFNALLDKAEDPQKMIDQYLRNLNDDLAKVKAETASVMAEEKSAKRKLDDCEAEIAKMGEYARKAVAAGNDDEAKQFLTKKAELTQKQTVLQQNYTLACENAAKMRDMHDKLEADITSINLVPGWKAPAITWQHLTAWKRKSIRCWMKQMPWLS